MLYDIFFIGSGCIVLKNGYTALTMDQFNSWCEEMIYGSNTLEKVTEDPGFHHPNQKGKFMINDILSRLAVTNIHLLFDLFYKTNGAFLMQWLEDVLLGFGKFGAAAAHWITPNSNTKQASHVDFPLNMNSSPFWEMSVEKMKRFTSREQMM